MASKAAKFYVERQLRRGVWTRTYWTCSPDYLRPIPAPRAKAAASLKKARQQWPDAKYRLREVGK